MSEVQIVKQNTEIVQFNYFDTDQFNVMQRVCASLSSSDMVPEPYQAGKVGKEKAIANCMIAVEMSMRIGCSALMVMQNLDIIYGRPGLRAKFLIATVNTCGRFEPLEFKRTDKGKVGKITITDYVWDNQAKKKLPKEVAFDGSEIDNIECIAFTTKRGSEKVLESTPVSILMAIKEGWYTKAGSKWPNMPEKMLVNRAASFWTNEYAPELSMGMHTADEVGDFIEFEEVDTKKKKIENTISNSANKTVVKMDTPAPPAAEPGKDAAQPQELKKEEEKPNEETNPI